MADLDRNFGDMPAGVGGSLARALHEKRKEIIMQADNALNDLQVGTL
jgi:hypothetical protein